MREACCSFAEKLAGLFSEVLFKTVTAAGLAELEEQEVTLTQLQALTWIAEHRRCAVGELAHGLGVTHPAAVKLVHRLQERALVERATSASDHRQAVLAVTPAGLCLVNAVRRERIRRLSRVLDRMDPDERLALIRGLEGFVTIALQDDRALDGLCWSCQTLLPTDCEDFEIIKERWNAEHTGLSG